MLVELNIRNFAIIDELKINFTKGLNIITGETGAGKSILIEAIGVILGSRINREYIQTGKEKATLEGVFYIENPQSLKSALDEYSIELGDDNLLIITKEIYLNGPSISKVNGKNLTLSMLKSVTNQLVDIFGQHEHQSLLDVANHISLVDSFGDERLLELKSKVNSLYEDLRIEKNRIMSLSNDSGERDREIDILKYQIQEIEDANLTQNDEEDIENEYRKLSNINTISQSIEEAVNYLSSNDFNYQDIISLYNRSLALISSAKKYDGALEDLYKRMEDINFELQDIKSELTYYLENIDVDSKRMFFLEERINIVNKLRKKYGNFINDIILFKQKAKSRLEILLNYEKEYESHKIKIEKLQELIEDYSTRLSLERKKIGRILEEKIEVELRELNMSDINFKIKFDKLNDITFNGHDKIEFLISTNPGEHLKSLTKIVSGGEMSRIMLGFKSIIAVQDKIPTLIFDEIDTGISGRTAQIVGQKISRISGSHQVICISHLPQIAAFADSHFAINKIYTKNKAKTTVTMLSDKDRVKEMARLLGGANLTDTTLKHASEMINMTKKFKKN
ncbi:MAG: DNA repair protein RecN [Tissierellaceae bacterium]|nr:DNA repair protein RecN [Tissierellaceae bacterium]